MCILDTQGYSIFITSYRNYLTFVKFIKSAQILQIANFRGDQNLWSQTDAKILFTGFVEQRGAFRGDVDQNISWYAQCLKNRGGR